MKHIFILIFLISIFNGYSQKDNQSQEILKHVCISGNCNMGFGVMKWDDGTIYIGDWWNEIPSGQGTVIWSDGSVYSGEFKEGMYSGNGTLVSSQHLYVGEFSEDFPEGHGTMLMTSGMYVGDFFNGNMHGKGFFINKQGVLEEATWENNIPIGDTLMIRENYILRKVNK